MAKITRLGGMTDATVRVLLPGVVDRGDVVSLAEVIAEMPPLTEAERAQIEANTDALMRGENPWPGSSSETSPVKPPKNDEPQKPSRRSRARTTGVPSKSTGVSTTARTGTTNGPATDA